MRAEKLALRHLFETKSVEFLSQLRDEYFIHPMPKTIFKGIRSYVSAFHKIPDKEVFKSKLATKLPESKVDIYLNFIDGLDLLEEEVSAQEILQLLKDQYTVEIMDKNIEALVLASQSKNIDAIKSLVHKISNDISVTEKLPEDISSLEYVPSKIKLIDSFLETQRRENLKLGGLVLIGGGSGTGKSAYGLNQLLYSYKQGHDVCLINMELGLDETLARMYCIETGDSFTSVYGNTDPAVVEKINNWKKDFFSRPNKFYIKNSSFDQIELTNIVTAMAKKGVGVFLIDYVNLVEIHTEEEWRGLTKLIKGLHRLTQELSCVIITPTQVNMTDTKEKDGQLKITTRGSKELEFSASVFLFIYQTPEEYENSVARVFTIKSRNSAKKTYVIETDYDKMRVLDTGMTL
jgi:archaellum biogenesis ATPase FlaH